MKRVDGFPKHERLLCFKDTGFAHLFCCRCYFGPPRLVKLLEGFKAR
jgi:hypothetical protein